MLTLRKHRISRLEEFSDAVFGFALTLLVLSTTVPRSYAQLMDLMKGLPAFVCCFAILVWIWHEHDSLFERYALNDNVTTLLNSLLLFVMLIFVYPLKFMFESFMAQFGLGPGTDPVIPMRFHELANASMLYGLGFFVLTGLFALLYLNAYRRRAKLELTALQAFDARLFAAHHMVSASVGLIAMFVAMVVPLHLSFLSPSALGLMGPAHYIYGRRSARLREEFITSQSEQPEAV